MSDMNAAKVKELRERTGAGMMDCKKALDAANGDLDAAIDALRKKGLASAAKKAGRVAAEGLVGVVSAKTKGAIVEINAETDFVARNENFQAFVTAMADMALTVPGDAEALKKAAYPKKSHTVADELTNLVATIGENMALRRVERLSVGQGIVSAYMHSAQKPGLGRIGVLVALESAGNPDRLMEVGRQIAMHVAAAKPEALDISSVDPKALAREKDVLTEQAKASGKPADIAAKMVEGRIRKYYEDVVLLEQAYIVNPDMRIKQVLEDLAKELKTPVVLKGFVRYGLGEGIEKEKADFAAEVAAAAKVG